MISPQSAPWSSSAAYLGASPRSVPSQNVGKLISPQRSESRLFQILNHRKIRRHSWANTTRSSPLLSSAVSSPRMIFTSAKTGCFTKRRKIQLLISVKQYHIHILLFQKFRRGNTADSRTNHKHCLPVRSMFFLLYPSNRAIMHKIAAVIENTATTRLDHPPAQNDDGSAPYGKSAFRRSF